MSTASSAESRPLSRRSRPARLAALGLLLAGAATAAAQFTDYTELDLEELSLVRISSLGRKQTPLFDSPSAATIITNDDLHRSGAITFAEALRQVPGLQVARINPVDYAISIRGFNDATSNKLLVLMDGRSLYSTTFSGAHWNFHDLVLEDVERIEVLRGPGASLWGANAMNGVINIVNRDARDTIGSLASLAFGDELESSVTARHGWRIGDHGSIRVYGRYQEHGSYGVERGNATGGWDSRLGGARYDWHGTQGGHLTLIGEVREQHSVALTALSTLTPPYVDLVDEKRHTRGSNVSARWAQPVWDHGEIIAFASYERLDATQVTYGEERNTINLDLQATLRPFRHHEIITGATYRNDDDHLHSTPWTRFGKEEASTTFVGAFVQDEITLLPDRLSVTIGTKFERNSFSGWETQPALRGIWKPTKQQRLWFGISRAARTPSRSERSVDLFAAVFPPSDTLPLPVAFVAHGSDQFSSEHVTSFELGHRYEPNRRVSLDLALFHSRYTDLRGLLIDELTPVMTPVPHLNLGLLATNNIKGTTTGGEFAARYHPSSTLTLEGSFSAMAYDLGEGSQSINPLDGLPITDPTISGWEGSSPRHETKVRLLWDPHPRWSADLAVRHVGQLRGVTVDAYTGVDLRVGWRVRPNLELELVGRDLLDSRHIETATSYLGGELNEIARSFFLRATWRH